MKICTCVIWFLMAVSNATAFSQNVAITASVDKQKILIGEPLHLNVKVSAPKNKMVQWLTIDTIPHFEILSKTKIDSGLNGNNLQFQQTYTITSWDSGRWQLPSLHLPPPAANKTKPIPIDVTFTPFDPAKDYNDVKDIIETTPPARTTWYWYVISAALLIGLLIMLFPKKKKQAAAATSDTNSYKQALQQLEKLKKGMNTEIDAKLFYTELINIFRGYLQKRKNIYSFSKTTDDLALQIKSLKMPSDNYNQLIQTLQLSDFVKFARFQPAADENKAALETIKKSIITIENLE